MKKFIVLSVVILSAFILSACDGDSSPSAASSGPIVSKAQAELDRADADRRIRLANAAIAQATADAQAFELQQRKAAAAATAEAVKLQATVNAQNAQATAQARAAQQTASALEAQATVEARSAAATATASAQEIQQGIERAQATATQQAIVLQNERSQADVRRAQSDSEFYNLVFRLAVIAFILAAFIIAVMAALQFLQTTFMRRTVIETRLGTMVFVGGPRSGYTPTLLQVPTLALPSSDGHTDTQAHIVDAKSFILHQGGKTFTIDNSDPTNTEWKLARRLLRDAMRIVGSQGDYIPSADVLGWPDDSRNRAVTLLKPHLSARVGKPPKGQEGKGTILDPRGHYRTLAQLYSDVTNRTIALSPLPTNGHAKP